MKPFRIIDAPQRSAAWFAARLGKLTGSVAGDMLTKIKTGEAAGRRNLRLRLVLERVTGKSQEPDFTSAAMQVGIDREDGAVSAFESLTGEVVLRTGFLAHTVHQAGASLDGHLGDFDALLSIKCRQPAAHMEFLRSGVIPASALAQIRHELWITSALTHTYFSWNPDFPRALQSRFVVVPQAAAEIPAYEEAALSFLAEVDREEAALRTMTDTRAVLAQTLKEQTSVA